MGMWKEIVDSAQRTLGPSLDHALQTAIVAVMTLAAAALLVTHPAPSHAAHTHRSPHVVAVGSAGSNVLQMHNSTLAEALDPQR